jgi:pimeloyl-ACP methyl ester carboxylesterase
MVNFAEKQAEADGLPAQNAKVWYYGVSYGTVLGMTFATLYPDRIGRAVLDSFVDGDDWFQGSWLSIAVDTGKAIDRFCQLCYQAGKDMCAFWDESPAAIEARMGRLIDSVRADPIPVADKSVGYPRIVKTEQLKFFMQSSLARQFSFPALAEGLKLLEARNGTVIANIGAWSDQLAAQTFIPCLDAAKRLDLSTLEKWKDYVKRANEVSQWVPDVWQAVPGMCSKTRDIVPPPSQLFNGKPSRPLDVGDNLS